MFYRFSALIMYQRERDFLNSSIYWFRSGGALQGHGTTITAMIMISGSGHLQSALLMRVTWEEIWYSLSQTSRDLPSDKDVLQDPTTRGTIFTLLPVTTKYVTFPNPKNTLSFSKYIPHPFLSSCAFLIVFHFLFWTHSPSFLNAFLVILARIWLTELQDFSHFFLSFPVSER